jgi:hypothetical protein
MMRRRNPDYRACRPEMALILWTDQGKKGWGHLAARSCQMA